MSDFKLKTFDTQNFLLLETRPAGTYTVTLECQGNSILSTLYVKTLDGGATVKANYYEDTLGGQFGERKELPGHPIQSAASSDPSKITITPFHNSPVLEVIVAGGSAEFSVRGTAVNSFATDLDAALQFDGATHVPADDKGLPAMCLDETTNLLSFLRCKDGGLIVAGSTDPSVIGTPFYYDVIDVTPTAGALETIGSFTVPVGTTRKLTKVQLSTQHPGKWTLDSGGSIIASGRIHAGHPESIFEFNPTRSISASTLVELNYLARAGQSNSDVSFHIMGNDFT